MKDLKSIILGLKFAFSYFTILPVKFKEEDDLSTKSVLSYLLLFLPIISIVLSLIVLSIYSLLYDLGWLAAIIASVSYLILYGFIHTDGLIDVVDAIYAKHSGKDTYEIIKQSTVGAMGILYSVSLILVKIAVFSYMLLNEYFLEFILIIFLSRYFIVISIFFYEFKSSFVTMLSNSISINKTLLLTAIAIVLGFYILGFSFVLFMIIAFVLTLIINKFLKSNLGFLNGDCMGALLEILEITLPIIILLGLV